MGFRSFILLCTLIAGVLGAQTFHEINNLMKYSAESSNDIYFKMKVDSKRLLHLEISEFTGCATAAIGKLDAQGDFQSVDDMIQPRSVREFSLEFVTDDYVYFRVSPFSHGDAQHTCKLSIRVWSTIALFSEAPTHFVSEKATEIFDFIRCQEDEQVTIQVDDGASHHFKLYHPRTKETPIMEGDMKGNKTLIDVSSAEETPKMGLFFIEIDGLEVGGDGVSVTVDVSEPDDFAPSNPIHYQTIANYPRCESHAHIEPPTEELGDSVYFVLPKSGWPSEEIYYVGYRDSRPLVLSDEYSGDYEPQDIKRTVYVRENSILPADSAFGFHPEYGALDLESDYDKKEVMSFLSHSHHAVSFGAERQFEWMPTEQDEVYRMFFYNSGYDATAFAGEIVHGVSLYFEQIADLDGYLLHSGHMNIMENYPPEKNGASTMKSAVQASQDAVVHQFLIGTDKASSFYWVHLKSKRPFNGKFQSSGAKIYDVTDAVLTTYAQAPVHMMIKVDTTVDEYSVSITSQGEFHGRVYISCKYIMPNSYGAHQFYDNVKQVSSADTSFRIETQGQSVIYLTYTNEFGSNPIVVNVDPIRRGQQELEKSIPLEIKDLSLSQSRSFILKKDQDPSTRVVGGLLEVDKASFATVVRECSVDADNRLQLRIQLRASNYTRDAFVTATRDNAYILGEYMPSDTMEFTINPINVKDECKNRVISANVTMFTPYQRRDDGLGISAALRSNAVFMFYLRRGSNTYTAVNASIDTDKEVTYQMEFLKVDEDQTLCKFDKKCSVGIPHANTSSEDESLIRIHNVGTSGLGVDDVVTVNFNVELYKETPLGTRNFYIFSSQEKESTNPRFEEYVVPILHKTELRQSLITRINLTNFDETPKDDDEVVLCLTDKRITTGIEALQKENCPVSYLSAHVNKAGDLGYVFVIERSLDIPQGDVIFAYLISRGTNKHSARTLLFDVNMPYILPSYTREEFKKAQKLITVPVYPNSFTAIEFTYKGDPKTAGDVDTTTDARRDMTFYLKPVEGENMDFNEALHTRFNSYVSFDYDCMDPDFEDSIRASETTTGYHAATVEQKMLQYFDKNNKTTIITYFFRLVRGSSYGTHSFNVDVYTANPGIVQLSEDSDDLMIAGSLGPYTFKPSKAAFQYYSPGPDGGVEYPELAIDVCRGSAGLVYDFDPSFTIRTIKGAQWPVSVPASENHKFESHWFDSLKRFEDGALADLTSLRSFALYFKFSSDRDEEVTIEALTTSAVRNRPTVGTGAVTFTATRQHDVIMNIPAAKKAQYASDLTYSVYGFSTNQSKDVNADVPCGAELGMKLINKYSPEPVTENDDFTSIRIPHHIVNKMKRNHITQLFVVAANRMTQDDEAKAVYPPISYDVRSIKFPLSSGAIATIVVLIVFAVIGAAGAVTYYLQRSRLMARRKHYSTIDADFAGDADAV